MQMIRINLLGGKEEAMPLPKDPYILLSYVNMKLRDRYSSLDEFCEEEGEDRDALVTALAAAGFTYHTETNSFG